MAVLVDHPSVAWWPPTRPARHPAQHLAQRHVGAVPPRQKLHRRVDELVADVARQAKPQVADGSQLALQKLIARRWHAGIYTHLSSAGVLEVYIPQHMPTPMDTSTREHSWTYDEGGEIDGVSWPDGPLYCQLCYHERTERKNPDGSTRFYDYIPESDEPECTGDSRTATG